MNIKTSDFFIALLSSIVFVSSFGFFFGVYYADYEGIAANIISGLWFDNSKAGSFWCSDHGLLLIAGLGSINQFIDIPLWGIMHLIFLVIGFTLINKIFIYQFNGLNFPARFILIILNSFFMFSFILLNITCHATSFIILFPSLYFLIYKQQINQRRFLLYMLLIIGILLRIQIFPFALILVIAFLWLKNTLSMVQFKRALLPILLYGLIYVVFTVTWQQSNNYGIRFLNNYELEILDRGNVKPLPDYANEAEKLRYDALTKYVFLDSEQMSDDYLYGIIKYKTLREYVFNLSEFRDIIFENLLSSFNALLTKYNFIPVFIWLFVILFFLSIMIRNYYHIIKITLLFFIYFLIIVLLSPFIIVPERFSATFIILCFFIMQYSIVSQLMNDMNGVMQNSTRILMAGLVLLIPATYGLKFSIIESEAFKSYEKRALNTYDEINQLSKNKIIFVIDYPWSMNNRNVLTTPSGVENNNIIFLQADVLTYLPIAYSKIKLYTDDDPTSWKNKSELIHEKAGDAYIVTIKGYSHFLTNYIKTFYGYELYDLKFYQTDIEMVDDIEMFSYSSRKIY